MKQWTGETQCSVLVRMRGAIEFDDQKEDRCIWFGVSKEVLEEDWRLKLCLKG